MKAVIVPNDQMQTPHYSVLRVRKGEETSTLSYLLPKLHEEDMERPLEDAPMERKRRSNRPRLPSPCPPMRRRRLKKLSPWPSLPLPPPRLKPQRRSPPSQASGPPVRGFEEPVRR